MGRGSEAIRIDPEEEFLQQAYESLIPSVMLAISQKEQSANLEFLRNIIDDNFPEFNSLLDRFGETTTTIGFEPPSEMQHLLSSRALGMFPGMELAAALVALSRKLKKEAELDNTGREIKLSDAQLERINHVMQTSRSQKRMHIKGDFVDMEKALREGLISSEEEFTPDVVSAGFKGVEVPIEGDNTHLYGNL